jgi:RimJ/RimL family protein N-acetyltransferase
MKYDIIPFKKEHWYQLRFRDDAEALTGLPDAEHARILAGGGPAYSAYADGTIIGMGGVFILWPGTGEAWCLVSPEIRKHGIFFTRAVKRYLDMIAKLKNLERIQAAVQVDFQVGLKFIEALGFGAEGVMEKFFNGKTFIRFAKFYSKEEP